MLHTSEPVKRTQLLQVSLLSGLTFPSRNTCAVKTVWCHLVSQLIALKRPSPQRAVLKETAAQVVSVTHPHKAILKIIEMTEQKINVLRDFWGSGGLG